MRTWMSWHWKRFAALLSYANSVKITTYATISGKHPTSVNKGRHISIPGAPHLSLLMMSSVWAESTRGPAGPSRSLLRSPSASIITLTIGFHHELHFTEQYLSDGTLVPRGGTVMLLVSVGSAWSFGAWVGRATFGTQDHSNHIIQMPSHTPLERQDDSGWSIRRICSSPRAPLLALLSSHSGLSPVVVLIYKRGGERLAEPPAPRHGWGKTEIWS